MCEQHLNHVTRALRDAKKIMLSNEPGGPPVTFAIKDSGARADYGTGMVRDIDDDKPDYERLFFGPMADRLATHLMKGAKKYPDDADGTPNWMHAKTQEELIRFRKSAARHFRQWLRGDEDEDHAAAVSFNINGAEYVKLRLKEGK